MPPLWERLGELAMPVAGYLTTVRACIDDLWIARVRSDVAAFAAAYGIPACAVDPARSLTVMNAAAPPYGLAVGLVWWSIGMILAAIYFTYVGR